MGETVVATTAGVVGEVDAFLKNVYFSGAPRGDKSGINHHKNIFLHFPIENITSLDASIHKPLDLDMHQVLHGLGKFVLDECICI